MMGGSYATHREDLDVPDATFTRPDLTTFARLDDLGLEVVGQRLEPGRAVLACRVVEDEGWCRRCGCEGVPRDTVIRRLAHEPLGWRPTTLEVTVRRYRCIGCGHVWRQDTALAAEARAELSRGALRWALVAIVCQHLTVARVAEALAVSWDTANAAILTEGRRLLINDPHRFDGVKVLGVDEHCWRHTRRGDKYVTVIIDLTPVREGTGPARLLDMVEGRSKQVFKQWLADRPADWRAALEEVAMDGFSGFKTATAEGSPTPSPSWTPSTSSGWPATRSMNAAAASSRTPAGTAAARATPCTPLGAPCTPAPNCSPTSRPSGSRHCSTAMSTWRSRRPGASTRR